MRSLVSGRNRPGAGGPPVEEKPDVPGRFQLANIAALPDPVLRQMVPMPRLDLVVDSGETSVAFRSATGETGVVELGPGAGPIARLFDGVRTLEQIGSMLDAEAHATAGGGFVLARDVFLALSARGIYRPAGPPPVAPAMSAPTQEQALHRPQVMKERQSGVEAVRSLRDGHRGQSARTGLLLVVAFIVICLAAWASLHALPGCACRGGR